ncbi:membrane transport protein-domain-containing protein [Crepidotus variabilis]|uniref:Membrane transport protein-domain-containing protein n=1 Tax=Crepidotus variabilis TaxID=179855 RepID=A0A9P6JIX8_9AGAR|nr:membrane transport protein-domain-containing protein [Crepidotus variabilis]
MRIQSASTPFTQLLLAVFNSILEVFILSLSGYILARHGILDKKTQKQINRLNVSLFTPALLFSKVAFFLTPEKLKELWIIPLWFALVTTASMLVGKVLGYTFRLKRSQRNFVMAAAMFMNSNALPIALMQSLVVSVPDLAWGPGDNKNAMLGRALTYLTMYSTLGMVVRYSYGVSLLSKADTINVAPIHNTENDQSGPTERTPLLQSNPTTDDAHIHDLTSSVTIAASSSSKSSRRSSAHSGTRPFDRVASPEPILNGLPELNRSFNSQQTPYSAASSRPRLPLRRNTTFYNSFPNSPNDSRTNLAQYDSHSDLEEAIVQSPSGLPTPGGQARSSPPPRPFMRRLKKKLTRMAIAIYDFMTVPMWSALASLIVACIPQVKHALEHHLQPLNGAINTAGKCAVPLTLVVLGAYFHVPPPDSDKPRVVTTTPQGDTSLVHRVLKTLHLRSSHQTQPQPKQPSHPGELKTVTLAVLSRMILTPILLVPLMVLATKFGWHDIFDDPVFVTVNTILLCSPPALTLAQITAATSGDAFERLISRTIFWSYCIATPPVTIGCVLLGLWLSKL